MKRIVGLLVALSACAEAPELDSESSELAARGNYVVVFRSETLPADANARIKAAGASTKRALAPIGVALVSATSSAASKLAKDSAVLSVAAERWFKPATLARYEGAVAQQGDPFSFLQWDMERVGAGAVWARNAPAVTVAVIDSGIAHNHPDLAGQVIYSTTTSVCGYGDVGYPIYDQVVDFTVDPPVCAPTTPTFHFHGTHVAGTIAAKHDGLGIVGVAPNAKLASYKVGDRVRFIDEFGMVVETDAIFDMAIYEAVIQATQNGHKVINMSLGGWIDRSTKDGNTFWLAADRVARYASKNGALIVAAAGNESSSTNGSLAVFPGDLPSVMSVAATGTSQLVFDGTGLVPAPGSDVLAFYSNTGGSVDIAAPGGDCGPGFPASCDPVHLIASTCIMENGALDWCWAAGTSMAAPHVAGAAALVRGKYPSMTAPALRARLKDTATDVGLVGAGAGVLDADLASR